jgi:hypothetical protein
MPEQFQRGVPRLPRRTAFDPTAASLTPLPAHGFSAFLCVRYHQNALVVREKSSRKKGAQKMRSLSCPFRGMMPMTNLTIVSAHTTDYKRDRSYHPIIYVLKVQQSSVSLY